MSLPLVTRFGADPLLDLELANKQYVDAGGGGGSGLTFARKIKATDESITSDIVPHDDDTLFFTPNINKTYFILLIMFFNTPSPADIRTSMSIPTGATATRFNGTWSGVSGGNVADWEVDDFNAGSSATQYITMAGRVKMGATAGDINWQWAQFVANAGATTVEQGSMLLAWESE